MMKAAPMQPSYKSTSVPESTRTFKLTQPEGVTDEILLSKYQALLEENENLREKVEKQTGSLKLMKGQFEQEKRTCKELKTDQATYF